MPCHVLRVKPSRMSNAEVTPLRKAASYKQRKRRIIT